MATIELIQEISTESDQVYRVRRPGKENELINYWDNRYWLPPTEDGKAVWFRTMEEAIASLN